MKKTHLPKFKNIVKKQNPKLLVAVGITGFIGTAILTGKASIKANELLKEKKEELNVDALEPKEVIKTTYKCYITPLISGVLSTACILGANSMHAKRTAALATAYQVAQAGINEYKDSVVELIGEEKEKEISKRTIDKKVQKIKPKEDSICVINQGDILCLDSFTGREFYSTENKIDKAINRVNSAIYHDNYVSLNQYFRFLDSPQLGNADIGDYVGWNTSCREVKICKYPTITKDGRPCLGVEFTRDSLPVYEFDRFD